MIPPELQDNALAITTCPGWSTASGFTGPLDDWARGSGFRWGTNGCSGGYLIFTRTTSTATIGPETKAELAAYDSESVAELAELVWSFDQAVDAAIANFVDFCRNYEVVYRVMLVEETVRDFQRKDRSQPNGEAASSAAETSETDS